MNNEVHLLSIYYFLYIFIEEEGRSVEWKRIELRTICECFRQSPINAAVVQTPTAPLHAKLVRYNLQTVLHTFLFGIYIHIFVYIVGVLQ